jgi:hypothetical protein
LDSASGGGETDSSTAGGAGVGSDTTDMAATASASDGAGGSGSGSGTGSGSGSGDGSGAGSGSDSGRATVGASAAGTTAGGTSATGASVGEDRVVIEKPLPGAVPAWTSTSNTGAGTGAPVGWTAMVWNVPATSRSMPVNDPTPVRVSSPSVPMRWTSTEP